MTRNNLLIVSHLGMGDHLVTCGMVRHFAKIHDLVVVCAKYNNLESVGFMYRDLVNVAVRPVLDHDDQTFFAKQVWKGEVLWTGMDGFKYNQDCWDEILYRQAKLSFQLRWDYFHFQPEPRFEIEQSGDFVFVHQDEAREMPIPFNRIHDLEGGHTFNLQPRIDISRNIFAWRQALLKAKAIHCIPSSFSLLVDSMERVPGQRLYLHKYARPKTNMPIYRYDWTIL